MCVCVLGGALLFRLSNKLHNVIEMFLSWDVLQMRRQGLADCKQRAFLRDKLLIAR